ETRSAAIDLGFLRVQVTQPRGGQTLMEINQDLYPMCGSTELPGETAFHQKDLGPEIAGDSGARIDVIVMSYSNQCPDGCTRVPHFSNPDVLHAGVATGIADQRDNHRTADLTAPIVANFRAQTCTIDTDYSLQSHTITTAETYEACRTITAGPEVTVASTGNLTLRSGESITLDNGFSVESGGRFMAEIDPAVGAP
ncbi:MAG: 3-coathanger stack domain-containing protein, partial [Thermoanaerobaculales bacterium]